MGEKVNLLTLFKGFLKVDREKVNLLDLSGFCLTMGEKVNLLDLSGFCLTMGEKVNLLPPLKRFPQSR